MRNDQIFVLLLVVLLPMSGCMDAAVGDVEGTEDAESTTPVVNNTTVVNNYYNQTTNQPPQFYIAGVGYNDESLGRVSTFDPSTGEELTRMYHTTFQFWFSVTDVDSNITSVGLDLDLDQVIDHPFVTNESWSNFTYHEGPGIAQSNGSLANYGHGEWASYPQYCFARFNLMAFDDDGGVQIIPYTLRMDDALPHDAVSCQSDYTGVEDHS